MTCWLVCHMWLDWAAHHEGMVAYYHWPKESCIQPMYDPDAFARQPNMFEWYFEQPNLSQFTSQPPPKDATWVWEDASTMPARVPGNWPMAEQTYTWYERLRFKPEVTTRANQLIAKYGLNPSKTIAVSRRACEAALDDERDHASETISNYFPHIDQLIANDPDLRILVTSEEQGDAEQVAARYPNRTSAISEFWTVPKGYGSAPGQPLHSGWCNPVSGYERGMHTCLLMAVLSQCRYYVKNKSNMSQIIGWLKKGQGVFRVGSRAHSTFWA